MLKPAWLRELNQNRAELKGFFLPPRADDQGAMPNSPSAAKRMRQGAKRRLRNRVTKKVIKTFSKRAMTALAANDFEKALADLKAASSKIDKAGARHKSKLARAYSAAVAKSKQA